MANGLNRIEQGRIEQGRSEQGRSVPVQAVRRLDGRVGLDRALDGQIQVVQALRGLPAARAGWHGLSPPAAESRGQAERGPAASLAAQPGEAMVPERAEVVRVLMRVRGQVLAENGPLTARLGQVVRPSGLMCHAAKALRVSGRAAKVRGLSAGQGPAGSPSRASIERVRAAIDPDPDRGPRRAGSRNPATRGSRAGRVQSERGRARNAQGRAARSLGASGLRQNRSSFQPSTFNSLGG